MRALKRADEFLMWLMTISGAPKRFNSPLAHFIFAVMFQVLVAAMFISNDMFDDWTLYFVVPFYLLGIYYQ